MKIIPPIIICLIYLSGCATNSKIDRTARYNFDTRYNDIEKFMFWSVVKNIVAYQFREIQYEENKRKYSPGQDPRSIYAMNINSIQDLFTHVNPVDWLIFFKRSALPFIDTTYALYEFHWNSFLHVRYLPYLKRTVTPSLIINDGGTPYWFLVQNGLVAIPKDTNNERILFISGQIYLHNIAYDYFRTNCTEQSLRDYIQLKYYNYEPDSIKVDSSLRRGRFYSALLKLNYEVQIVQDSTIYGGVKDVFKKIE